MSSRKGEYVQCSYCYKKFLPISMKDTPHDYNLSKEELLAMKIQFRTTASLPNRLIKGNVVRDQEDYLKERDKQLQDNETYKSRGTLSRELN